MQEQPNCNHQSQELLICLAEECKDTPNQHIVCTQCCFYTHSHQLMNFRRLTPLEKQCYNLSPLFSRKSLIQQNITTKFSSIKEQLLDQLNKKENHMFHKLNEILSQEIETLVHQSFVTEQVTEQLTHIPEQVLNKLKNIEQINKQLNQFQSEVQALTIDEAFGYKNNTNYPSVSQTVAHLEQDENQKVKTEPRDHYRSARIKYFSQREQRQPDGTILIDLQDTDFIPNNIQAENFANISSILKFHSNITNATITLASIPQTEHSYMQSDLDDLYKKKFISDLGSLKCLQDLSLNIGQGDKLTYWDLQSLEKVLCGLQSLLKFKIQYYPHDEKTRGFKFGNLKNKLGASNLEILEKNSFK